MLLVKDAGCVHTHTHRHTLKGDGAQVSPASPEPVL